MHVLSPTHIRIPIYRCLSAYAQKITFELEIDSQRWLKNYDWTGGWKRNKERLENRQVDIKQERKRMNEWEEQINFNAQLNEEKSKMVLLHDIYIWIRNIRKNWIVVYNDRYSHTDTQFKTPKFYGWIVQETQSNGLKPRLKHV